ncbi:hypothetical protein G3A39_42660 [Paraburkholderia aspalathi]|nr:hypothetical protein [Paraburkholderia aspalathi]
MLSLLKHWRVLALIGLCGAGLALYLTGKQDGRQRASITVLETSVKTLREKGQINAQVSISDAADLCSDYGLPVDEQTECVRRVREASAKP